jgi:hypothetical protein
MMADLRELWTFKSFRARIFLAIIPTTIAMVVGFFALDRQPPYDFYTQEHGSNIEPPAGAAGDTVTVNWRVRFHRQCDGTVERQLVDPATDVILAAYAVAPAAQNGIKIGEEYLRKPLTLPNNIKRGTIAYQAKLTYQCNWLQRAWPFFAIRYTTPKLLFHLEG